MQFTKYLRDGVRSGAITCSVRVWMYPRVKVGNRYRMEGGAIEIDSIESITFDDITSALARASGFAGVDDLLKVAKHGRGENVYLVRFHYVPAGRE
ncbi:MAG: ASCH domain-containing protein [Acidobacteriota bacterium]|nr:ASCH domain-containing protein [Acidobacteriota bacterium]